MSTIRSFGASFMSRVGQLASSISSTASEMRPSLFDAPASNALDFESDSDDDGYGATPPSRQQEQQQPTPPPTGGGGPTKPARGRPSKLGRSKTVNFRGSRNRDKEVAVALDEVYSQNPAPIPMRQSMVYRTKNWHDDEDKPALEVPFNMTLPKTSKIRVRARDAAASVVDPSSPLGDGQTSLEDVIQARTFSLSQAGSRSSMDSRSDREEVSSDGQSSGEGASGDDEEEEQETVSNADAHDIGMDSHFDGTQEDGDFAFVSPLRGPSFGGENTDGDDDEQRDERATEGNSVVEDEFITPRDAIGGWIHDYGTGSFVAEELCIVELLRAENLPTVKEITKPRTTAHASTTAGGSNTNSSGYANASERTTSEDVQLHGTRPTDSRRIQSCDNDPPDPDLPVAPGTPSSGRPGSKRRITIFPGNAEAPTSGASMPNPFVTMRLRDGTTGNQKGTLKRWPKRVKTCNPVWNRPRYMGPYVEGDVLTMQLHHFAAAHSKSSSKESMLIGRASIPLRDVILRQEYACDVESEAHSNVKIYVRFLPRPQFFKTVYVLRHAESEWNRAQREKNFMSLANFDHGLSVMGCKQSQKFWRFIELSLCEAEIPAHMHTRARTETEGPRPERTSTQEALFTDSDTDTRSDGNVDLEPRPSIEEGHTPVHAFSDADVNHDEEDAAADDASATSSPTDEEEKGTPEEPSSRKSTGMRKYTLSAANLDAFLNLSPSDTNLELLIRRIYTAKNGNLPPRPKNRPPDFCPSTFLQYELPPKPAIIPHSSDAAASDGGPSTPLSPISPRKARGSSARKRKAMLTGIFQSVEDEEDEQDGKDEEPAPAGAPQSPPSDTSSRDQASSRSPSPSSSIPDAPPTQMVVGPALSEPSLSTHAADMNSPATPPTPHSAGPTSRALDSQQNPMLRTNPQTTATAPSTTQPQQREPPMLARPRLAPIPSSRSVRSIDFGNSDAFGRVIPLQEFDLKADVDMSTLSAPERAHNVESIKEFWEADVIWVSPLTRTIQTALIALQGHPVMRRRGMVLTSDAREVKGRGGLDTVGRAKGEEIRRRTYQLTREVYSKYKDFDRPDTMVAKLMRPHIDYNDATDEWWTDSLHSDKTEDVEERIDELLNSICFSESQTIVLVSHSLLIRKILSTRVHKDLKTVKPSLHAKSTKRKLENCGMVKLSLDFRNGLANCVIDFELVFGSAFEKEGNDSQSQSGAGQSGQSGGNYHSFHNHYKAMTPANSVRYTSGRGGANQYASFNDAAVSRNQQRGSDLTSPRSAPALPRRATVDPSGGSNGSGGRGVSPPRSPGRFMSRKKMSSTEMMWDQYGDKKDRNSSRDRSMDSIDEAQPPPGPPVPSSANGDDNDERGENGVSSGGLSASSSEEKDPSREPSTKAGVAGDSQTLDLAATAAMSSSS